MDEITKGQNMK